MSAKAAVGMCGSAGYDLKMISIRDDWLRGSNHNEPLNGIDTDRFPAILRVCPVSFHFAEMKVTGHEIIFSLLSDFDAITCELCNLQKHAILQSLIVMPHSNGVPGMC